MQTFVVCEARADFEIASVLAERIIRELVGRESDDPIVDLIEWRGERVSDPFTIWTSSMGIVKKPRPKFAPRHEGVQFPDFDAARKKLVALWDKHGASICIILVRDADDQPERQYGLERARNSGAWKDRTIIGFCNPKREAWVLCGFVPCSKEEQSAAAELQREGIRHLTHSHQLTATKDDAKLSAKRVLKRLLEPTDPKERAWRQKECWCETSIEHLEKHGEHNGLRNYLSEIRNRMCRLLLLTN